MKKASILTIAFLATLMLVSIGVAFPVRAEVRADCDIRFYGSADAGYAALKANDVDFIQWSLTHEQRLDAEADSNLCVAQYVENGMSEFDLNNNYTVPARNPGVRNPLHVKEFRQALSCAVDKEYIVDEILLGAGGILNVPIPLNSYSWWNSCLHQENFAWKYNITKAAELLDAAGFVDREPDGIRNYPLGWDGAEDGPNMDSYPLYVCIRTEDKRYDAGLHLCGQLDILDVAYIQVIGTSDVLFPIVMHDRNYHIYTGGWSLGRYPLFLYNGFHSDFWFPDGSNYVTGMNASNLPNYPKLDDLVSDIYYTPDIPTCLDAALKAGGYGWCDLVVNIPLWSYTSYVGWRKTMAGVINEFGYGYDNAYQFWNAYQSAGGPIRMATINAPKSGNPLYATWYYDYAVMDRVFNALMTVNPYDLAIDVPAAAQDWEVGTWVDPNPGPDEPSTKNWVIYYLRTDVGIAEPDTGNFVRNLNAHDLEFSCWYTYSFDDGWNWADYMDVHHSEIIDDYTIKFYFDDASYWFYTAPQYPIFAKTELIDLLCGMSSVSFASDGANCTTGTYFKLPNGNEQIIQVTSDDLTVDYVIFGGYEDYEHNWIWLQGDLPAGTYTINYYTPDVDPHGYYLAGLAWEATWYGFGPYYVIDMVTGVGGYATMNKNPYYWFGESPPPLGETDWRWWWDAGGGPENPGRDTGYYHINIYDVVKATASYCHRGDGDFDPDYFPGADLDSSDLGHIGIYDIVSITGKYGLKWGQPPPYP